MEIRRTKGKCENPAFLHNRQLINVLKQEDVHLKIFSFHLNIKQKKTSLTSCNWLEELFVVILKLKNLKRYLLSAS